MATIVCSVKEETDTTGDLVVKHGYYLSERGLYKALVCSYIGFQLRNIIIKHLSV